MHTRSYLSHRETHPSTIHEKEESGVKIELISLKWKKKIIWIVILLANKFDNINRSNSLCTAIDFKNHFHALSYHKRILIECNVINCNNLSVTITDQDQDL